jgi:hypothetical protein
VGHFGPKFEAEKDEILSRYLRDVVRKHQSSLLDFRLSLSLSLPHKNSLESERAFLKIFSFKLQTLKLNIKSTSFSKILKFWI